MISINLLNNNSVVYAQENDQLLYEEEFFCDSVLVVLDSSISGLNKIHSKSFLAESQSCYRQGLYRLFNLRLFNTKI